MTEHNELEVPAPGGRLVDVPRASPRHGADVAEPTTCGQGLAQNEVVPAALAGVAAGLARNLEVHMRALDREDPVAAQEHAVYERVARSLLGAAAELQDAANEMAAASDLPMGAHDILRRNLASGLWAFVVAFSREAAPYPSHGTSGDPASVRPNV
jgi:hypothetical protein